MEGLELIRGSHVEGLRLLDEALSLDEGGNSVDALASYRQALAVMAMGLEVRCDLQHCVGDGWTKARKWQQEMRRSGVQARNRIKDLEKLEKSGLSPYGCNTPTNLVTDHTPSDAVRNSPPPPYTERDENSSPFEPPPYSELPQTALTPSSINLPTLASSDHANGKNLTVIAKEESKSALADTAFDSNTDCLVATTKELFRIDKGVRLFRVNSDTNTITTSAVSSSPKALIIYKLPTPVDRSESFDCLEYILQVGDWIYPLSQKLSPILKTGSSTYMFPDLKDDAPSLASLETEMAIGLVLDTMVVPLDVRFIFQEKLKDLAFLLTVQEAEALGLLSTSQVDGASDGQRPTVNHHRVQPRGALAADFVARGMLTGASALSQGLVKGAQVAGSGIRKGSEILREKIEPVAAPIAVDPKVKVGIDVARKGSRAAVVAGGFVLEKLGDATMFVGKKMAPVVKDQANKYLPTKYQIGTGPDKGDDDGTLVGARPSTVTDKALTLAAGGLEGFMVVYQGLEAAGRILASSVAEEGVKMVDKRYGSEVAEATSSGLEAVGNIGYAGYLSGAFGAKALAKRVAKSTGRAILDDYSVEKTQPSFYENFSAKNNGVKLTDFVGKPIELSTVKSKEGGCATTASAADVDELTSPDQTSPVLSTSDDVKLQLHDAFAEDENTPIQSQPYCSSEKRPINEKDTVKHQRSSETCLEPDY